MPLPADRHVMHRTVIDRRVLLLKIVLMDHHEHSEHHRPFDALMVPMPHDNENPECTLHHFKSPEMIRQNSSKARRNKLLDTTTQDSSNNPGMVKTDNSNRLDMVKKDSNNNNNNHLCTAKTDNNSNKLDMVKTDDHNNHQVTVTTDSSTEEISKIIHNRIVLHQLVNRRSLDEHDHEIEWQRQPAINHNKGTDKINRSSNRTDKTNRNKDMDKTNRNKDTDKINRSNNRTDKTSRNKDMDKANRSKDPDKINRNKDPGKINRSKDMDEINRSSNRTDKTNGNQDNRLIHLNNSQARNIIHVRHLFIGRSFLRVLSKRGK